MLVVVASYRQNVHAYPSPAAATTRSPTVNLGPTRGLTVASALLVDYVLTVAVSISSGVRRTPRRRSPVAATGTRRSVAVVRRRDPRWLMNLRGVRESGTAFAIPTYVFMSAILGMVACRALPARCSATCRWRRARSYDDRAATAARPHRARRWSFLLLRAFSSGCAALTGVEAISNGVPAFRKPKSKNAATTLLLLGTHRGHDAAQRHRCWPTTMRRAATSTTRRPDCCLDGQPVGRLDQQTVIGQIGQAVFAQLPRSAFYFVAATTGADPGAGRQHRVQRLPGARLDPGPGRLPAPPAAHPRRPAGLQQRHHRCWPASPIVLIVAFDARGHRADPALHRRRVRLVHAQPDRHGPALDPASCGPRPTRRARRG